MPAVPPAPTSRSIRVATVIAALCSLLLLVKTEAAMTAELPPPWLPQAERDGATVFITGHSLTDLPLPNFLEAIARSQGATHVWNRQYIVGSTIQQRTRGTDSNVTDWPGYRRGDSKDGSPIDVVAELRSPKTPGAGPYDVLLITEMHSLLVSYLWFDTVRLLRHYHDLFISSNPQGRTYFYESWLGILDKSAPARWIEYERAASPVWQCAATRINVSLEHAGRKDRITPLPAGLALAELIARATKGAGLPGVTAASPRQTVDALVADDVHLTPRGSYYVALVTYAAIYRRSPVGAWAPSDIDAQTADAMQKFAWNFVVDFYARSQPMPLADCRALVAGPFNELFWNYTFDQGQQGRGWGPADLIRSINERLRKGRNIKRTTSTFSAEDASNPLYFSPALDAAYWYPPL
jgi:hypothetical protein